MNKHIKSFRLFENIKNVMPTTRSYVMDNIKHIENLEYEINVLTGVLRFFRNYVDPIKLGLAMNKESLEIDIRNGVEEEPYSFEDYDIDSLIEMRFGIIDITKNYDRQFKRDAKTELSTKEVQYLIDSDCIKFDKLVDDYFKYEEDGSLDWLKP